MKVTGFSVRESDGLLEIDSKLKQTCYDLMTDSEKCCKINNY